MLEADRKSHNQTLLSQCHPWFRPKLQAVIKDLEGHGFRPRIQCAWRSPKDQLQAFQSGYSKLRFGFHNVTISGQCCSMATDVLDDDHALSPSGKYLLLLASSAQSHGLTTGLCWGLPMRLRQGIQAAIAGKRWDAPIKRGWDPCHVEPTGLTPKQAQAGLTPTA
jgi:hypothetical protein